MGKALKIAYILAGGVLIYNVWTGIDVDESPGGLFGQVMKFRLVGFIALILIFYYVFFNFLGKKKDR